MHTASDTFEQQVFMHAPVGIAVIHSDSGEILHVNNEYCTMTGRTQKETEGANWMFCTYPDDVLDDFCCVLHIRSGASTKITKEKRFVLPDGTVTTVRMTIVPLDTEHPDQLLIVLIQDIPATETREKLRPQNDTVTEPYDAAFNSMMFLTQLRDRKAASSIIRPRLYVYMLLKHLPFRNPYSIREIHTICSSAMLYDIGKVGIPDRILLKSGKLTESEFKVMKTHTTLGARVIDEARRYTAKNNVLMFAREITESHHERWDGTGYPEGLSGAEIPLTARVMAIADVYDALRSVRPYKSAFSHEDAVRIITDGAGSQFDPSLVRVFMSFEKDFASISVMEKESLEKKLHNI